MKAAIMVPAARPASHLQTAIALAKECKLPIIVFGNKSCRLDHVRSQINREAFPPSWLAVQVPERYNHQLLHFKATNHRRVADTPIGDQWLKRNLGLLIAKMTGIEFAIFLDDDIHGVSFEMITMMMRQARAHRVSAVVYRRFPDNSVVRHAARRVNKLVAVYPSAGVYVVHVPSVRAHFPRMYNEDWLHYWMNRPNPSRTFEVFQEPYDPFMYLRRARSEEFGDLLVEALNRLSLPYMLSPEDPDSWLFANWMLPPGAKIELDPQFWSTELVVRERFIREIRTENATVGGDYGERFVLPALDASLTRLAKITVDDCISFLTEWQDDVEVWQERVSVFDGTMNLGAALSELGLVYYEGSLI